MIRKALYAFKKISERGVGFLFIYFRESIWFDLRHGTSTSARVPKDEQDIDGSEVEAEEGLLYVASFTSVVTKSVAVARGILGEARFAQAQFMDLGCGKGKTLLVYGLRCRAGQGAPAVGIEYDPTLTELARDNVVRCKLEDQITLVNDSAVNLRDHASADELIIYLYNSFQGETLRATLDVLKDVPHLLIYVDPAERAMLGDFGYRIVHDVKGRYNADTWLVARPPVLKDR